MVKLALIFIISIFALAGPLKAEEAYEPQCVQLVGWAPLNVFQSTLTFYSQCYMPKYISACVKERFGEWKLYKSFARVGTYGWWRLNIDSTYRPENVVIAYDHFTHPIPEPCQK
jgi:hypothetical protein